jgi:hypothetical protein
VARQAVSFFLPVCSHENFRVKSIPSYEKLPIAMAIRKEKLTKAALIREIDLKLQALNLLRSALAADPSRKQEDLENYRRQFLEMTSHDGHK